MSKGIELKGEPDGRLQEVEKKELKTRRATIKIIFIEGTPEKEIVNICNALSAEAHRLCAENEKVLALTPPMIDIEAET